MRNISPVRDRINEVSMSLSAMFRIVAARVSKLRMRLYHGRLLTASWFGRSIFKALNRDPAPCVLYHAYACIIDANKPNEGEDSHHS